MPAIDAADVLRNNDDLVGSVIGERFDVLERLTSGGMGVVYRAKHILLNSEVAIKVLLKPQDPDAQYRFLQEAQLACKVKHANTIVISDFGILPDGRSYIAMEFLRGPTLGKTISEGVLSPLRACRVAMQIARGLSAVHDKGIIHRDLKPENIFLVEQDGQKDFVKIVDFGIATDRVDTAEVRANIEKLKAEAAGRDSLRALKERHTLPGMVLGTPQYMSPEQAQGFDLTARADQYALGCIFYEMLCGTVPFDDNNAMAVMYKHALSPVPHLKDKNPSVSVPDSVERIVRRMLAKDPNQRYQSMREVEQALLDEIENLLGTVSPEEARALGLGPRPRMSTTGLRGLTRRWPLWMKVAAAWGSVLLIAGSVLLVYVVQKRRQRAELEQAALETQQLLGAREQALTVLKSDLRDPSTELRLGAVAALGDTRDAALAPAILPLLDDKEGRVQIKAAEVLGQLGRRDVTSNLAPLLDDAQGRSPLLQVAAAEALDLLGDARGRKALGRALLGKHDAARLRAALYLMGSGDREAQRLLSQVVHKGLAAEAAQLEILPKLAQSGDAEAKEALLTRLAGSPSRDTQIAVAGALLKLGEPRGREYLFDLLKKPGPEQLKAAVVLATQEEPVDPAVFRSVLDSPQAHPAARKVALLGLGYTGRREDLKRLLPLLERGDDPPLRQGAAAALLRMAAGDPAVVAMQDLTWAQGALAGDSALLREQAVAVLGDVGNAAAARVLGRTLKQGGDVALRIKAARALGQVRDREALLALKEGLQDQDAGVRQEVIKALGEAGRKLLARGQKSVLGEISGWLSGAVKGSGEASGREQALAQAALLRMGDESQRAPVTAALKSGDVDTRRQLIDQLDRDPVLLAEALGDVDLNVRRLAARKLAGLGDKRAAPVLREVVQSSPDSAEGLQAYALLRKLDPKAEAPTASQQLLGSEDPAARAAALEAVVAQGPSAGAQAALLKGTRDPDRNVRLAVAELAARQPTGAGVLRTLLRDQDPGVRARAAALLQQKEQPDEALDKDKDKDKGKAADPAKGKDAAEADAPRPAVDPETDKRGTGSRPETPEPAGREAIEKLLRTGNDALKEGQAGKAQRQLERAVSQCAREGQKICAPFAYELTYSLGRALQAQGRYADAMTEYEKLHKVHGGSGGQKREVATAMKELGPRLGKVTVLEKKKGKCQATAVFWLTPGQQTVRYGKASFQVKLRAQESQSVSTDSSCNADK
ncbi:MAG: HEAT repeat domain-containing protein [Polyangia bacterium]